MYSPSISWFNLYWKVRKAYLFTAEEVHQNTHSRPPHTVNNTKRQQKAVHCFLALRKKKKGRAIVSFQQSNFRILSQLTCFIILTIEVIQTTISELEPLESLFSSYFCSGLAFNSADRNHLLSFPIFLFLPCSFSSSWTYSDVLEDPPGDARSLFVAPFLQKKLDRKKAPLPTTSRPLLKNPLCWVARSAIFNQYSIDATTFHSRVDLCSCYYLSLVV